MKIAQLVNSEEAIKELVNLKMDVKKAYALRKFINEISSKTSAFIQTRNELIREYGEEKDGLITVKPENVEFFNKDIEEINEDIEIDIPEITIDDIEGKIDTAKLFQLDYLIK